MSDIFDHEGDAWESYERSFDEGYRPFCPKSRQQRGRDYDDFIKDPLFYHVFCPFEKIERETEKAYLFSFYLEDRWVPKSLCKQLNLDKNYVYIHQMYFKDKKKAP